jgi:2-keto-4-pentenoate hydratase/2-oxohepta-3-ene-1,7-dioic acid hydratase in catechol pathway
VKIGRFQDRDGTRFWGILEEGGSIVRWIEEPFMLWAPKLAEGGDDTGDVMLGRRSRFADLRLLAPVEPGARIFGTGVNYPTHLADGGDSNRKPPTTMPGYVKLDSTVVDPGEEIRYPANTEQLDYEIEIVLVVARPTLPGKPRTACLLGYTIGNDVSPRDVGRPTGGVDLYSMKAQDRTAPIGPWVATLGDFGGPGQPSFDFSLTLNGELRQHDNTKNMIWSLEEILQFFNERNRLRPGDLVFTGTTGGTGILTRRFLTSGDRLELEADGIGTLVNSVGAKGRPEEW